MWVDERGRVYTREPLRWSDVIRLSESSFEAFRRTPAAGSHDMLDAARGQMSSVSKDFTEERHVG
jgi:hypothetical protein